MVKNVTTRLSQRCGANAKEMARNGVHGKMTVLCTVNDRGGLKVVAEGNEAIQAVISGNEISCGSLSARSLGVPEALTSKTRSHRLLMPVPNQKPLANAIQPAAESVESSPEDSFDEFVDYDDSDDEVAASSRVARSFALSETDKVVAFLRQCSDRLQQQLIKKMSKAWIKGICLKKQARYPYQDKTKTDKGEHPMVPSWWPIEGCRFREPDHISKEERLHLFLHILRLRPTIEEFQEWNDKIDVSDQVKKITTESWTAFLRSLTPSSIFGELVREPKKRVEWDSLMGDLYKVADMEESYEKGERDGGDTWIYNDMPAVKPGGRKRQAIKKRSRHSSRSSSSSRRSADRSPSAERITKKTKRYTRMSRSSPRTQLVTRMSNTMLDDNPTVGATHVLPYRQAGKRSGTGFPHADNALAGGHHLDHAPMGVSLDSHHPSSVAESVSSASTGNVPSGYLQPPSDKGSATSTALKHYFASMHHRDQDARVPNYAQHQPMAVTQHQQAYAYPQYEQAQNIVSAYPVHGLPEPHFETVPNTPIFAHMHDFQSHGFAGQHDPAYHTHAHYEVAGMVPQQQYQQDEQSVVQQQHMTHGLPVQYPSHEYAPTPVMPQYHQQYHDHYDAKPQHYHHQQHVYNAVPQYYYHDVQHPPHHEQPYGYPEVMPENNFPAAALPGSVERGFTGHHSGVGGHAIAPNCAAVYPYE